MLPTLLLQPSEFASFDSDLNRPNPLPADATEPQVGFAELLGLNARPLPEPALPAGLALPVSGNALPAALPPHGPAVSLPAAAETEGLPGLPGMPAPAGRESAPLLEAGSGPRTGVPVLPPPAAMPATPAVSLTPQPAVTPLADLPVVAGGKTAVPAPTAALPDSEISDVARNLAGSVKTVGLQPANDIAIPRQPSAPGATGEPPRRIPVAPDREVTLPVDVARQPTEPREALRRPEALTAPPVRTPLHTPELPTADAAQPSRPLPAVTAPPAQAGPSLAPSPTAPDAVGVAVTQASPASLAPTAARPGAEPAPLPGTIAQRIEVPVRDAAWGEQLGQRLQLLTSNRLQTAEIRLTPAELGPLRVQVAIEDGAANVAFQAQHAVTREAIEQALPRLREMFAENGVQLNQADIGEQGVRQGDQQSREAHRSGGRNQGAAADAEAERGASPEPRGRNPDGLVDTFA